MTEKRAKKDVLDLFIGSGEKEILKLVKDISVLCLHFTQYASIFFIPQLQFKNNCSFITDVNPLTYLHGNYNLTIPTNTFISSGVPITTL